MTTHSDQLDIFTYPRRAGYTEGTTSKGAAEAIEASGKATTLRERVEAFFRRGHLATADEVAAALGVSPFSARPRVTELYSLGVIERTGHVNPSANGRPSHVYRLLHPRRTSND